MLQKQGGVGLSLRVHPGDKVPTHGACFASSPYIPLSRGMAEWQRNAFPRTTPWSNTGQHLGCPRHSNKLPENFSLHTCSRCQAWMESQRGHLRALSIPCTLIRHDICICDTWGWAFFRDLQTAISLSMSHTATLVKLHVIEDYSFVTLGKPAKFNTY